MTTARPIPSLHTSVEANRESQPNQKGNRPPHASHHIRRLVLLHLPPYAPELNPVENVWEYLRGNQLSLRLWNSYDAIVDACCSAWNAFIADAARVASVTKRDWATVDT